MGVHDAANFHCSLKLIADHLQLTCDNKVCKAICTMTPVVITIPPVPTGAKDSNDSSGKTILPVDNITIYLWKENHKKASAKLDKYEVDMARAYIIILHQCTPSLKNELEATDTFLGIRVAQDPIALLKLIQSLCCWYNAKTQSVMATVASHKRLFTYYQHDTDDNHKYYQDFCAHVETLDICPATTPINVHCNKDTLTTNQEADFGNTPVYFDNRGIANVLSPYRLGKKFKVTYDSTDRGGVFKVYTKQGVVEFKPTTNGLHALNLKTNPKSAFLLVNDADLHRSKPEDHQVHVATVHDNFENFSRKQIEGAQAAR